MDHRHGHRYDVRRLLKLGAEPGATPYAQPLRPTAAADRDSTPKAPADRLRPEAAADRDPSPHAAADRDSAQKHARSAHKHARSAKKRVRWHKFPASLRKA